MAWHWARMIEVRSYTKNTMIHEEHEGTRRDIIFVCLRGSKRHRNRKARDPIFLVQTHGVL